MTQTGVTMTVEEIPKGWRKVTIGEIGDVSTSSVDKKLQPDENKIQLINYMDVYKNLHKTIYASQRYMVVTAKNSQIESSCVKKGDVLITPTSETTDDIGKAAVVMEEIPNTLFSYHLVRLRFKQQVNLNFKRFLFNTEDIYKKYCLIAQGATRFVLNKGDLLQVEILLPPEKEQEKIAEILMTVDDDIEETDNIVDNCERIKTGLMQTLITKGIPGKHKKFKKTEIGEIPEDWEVKKLIDIAPLQRGFDLPSQMLKDGKYPVCYSNGISNHHSEFKVKGPGVFTGRSGTIGNVFYVEKDFWPHNTALWVTNFCKNYPKYIYYMYTYLKLDKFDAGTSVPTLNRNDVHNHKIAIPPLSEQKEIVLILENLDLRIKNEQDKRYQLENLKKSLMQKLLSGEIRVRV